MSLDTFGRDYLLLSLRIGKLIDGYIDAYFGPLELSQLVKEEKETSPKLLLKKCKNLHLDLHNQGYIEERVRFLDKMLSAMETSLELVQGKKIPFLEQVFRLYDIKPELIDDSVFHKLAAKMDSLYEGTGTIAERREAIEQRRTISKERVEEVYNRAFKIVKERTHELLGDLLPKSESLSLNFVTDQPWAAYNWYLGNFKSRIDINSDLPPDWSTMLMLASHEGYPGHHTEHATKEQLLYQNEQRFEHCVLIIQAPESVVAEGIGNTGIDLLFSSHERTTIELENLCPDKEEEMDIETLIAQQKIRTEARGLLNNLAIYAHVDGWSDDELVKYALDFGFVQENRVRQQLLFIRNPLWSSYTFNYFFGETLIKKKYGERPSVKDFKTLLTKPVLPSDLA